MTTLASNMKTQCVLLFILLGTPTVTSYGSFREEIPNGDHVPHPCQPNFIWHGVGHAQPQGGGARNPFGLDFANNGHTWSSALCLMDSDRDGKSNGQELGDPDCTWTKGQTPQHTKDVSHPGVCEPVNSAQCMGKNDWLDCNRDERFDCPHINDPDVLNITLRFPRSKVPAQETTYVCFNFDLPSDREYHVIGTQPFIDNHNVMHHIVVTGCPASVNLVSEPYDCLMGAEGCMVGLGGWTLGMNGQCYNPIAGIIMGKGGAVKAALQLHWTNPGLVDEWFDSSGIIIYYTPKLRKYNANSLSLGQMSLNIPPKQTAYVETGTCSRQCTEKIMKGPIHILETLHHMHYLGIRQNTTLTRPGQPTQLIIDDNPFSYDNPITHIHDPPLTIYPGDELTTHCTFQSRSREEVTTYGEGSYDEMCFSINMFYPAENMTTPVCVQAGDQDYCDLDFDTRLPRGGDKAANMYPPKPEEPREPETATSGIGSMFLNIIKQLDGRPLLQNIIMNINYNYGGGSNDHNDGDDHMVDWH